MVGECLTLVSSRLSRKVIRNLGKQRGLSPTWYAVQLVRVITAGNKELTEVHDVMVQALIGSHARAVCG